MDDVFDEAARTLLRRYREGLSANRYFSGEVLDAQWYVENMQYAADRVRQAIIKPHRLVTHVSHFGLGRPFTRVFFVERRVDVPFGWTRMKEPDRDVITVMPWWLAAFVLVRRYWPNWLFGRVLMPLGLWTLKEEGGFYVEGRFTCPMPIYRFVWCFLNDRDHFPIQFEPRFSDRPIASSPFNGLTPRQYNEARR